MKLGFICLNLPGHLNPMTALARRLPEKDQIDGSMPDLSKMQGEGALKSGIGLVMAPTESILKSLPAVVQANGIDSPVIDTLPFYSEFGAIQLGIAYIPVSNPLS